MAEVTEPLLESFCTAGAVSVAIGLIARRRSFYAERPTDATDRRIDDLMLWSSCYVLF